jgi:hypothetical protein
LLNFATRADEGSKGVFEREVFAALKTEQFLISADHYLCRWSLGSKELEFLARYVATRPYRIDTLWNAHFPVLVNAVVDKIFDLDVHFHKLQRHFEGKELFEEDGISENEDISHEILRLEYVRKLCHRASGETISGRRPQPLTSPIFRLNVLVAAIYLGKPYIARGYIEKLDLSDLLSIQQTHRGSWGTPLLAAIQMGNLNLIHQLLELVPTITTMDDLNTTLTYFRSAVRADSSKKIVTMLLTPQIKHLHRSYDYVEIIRLAIELGKPDVADILVDYFYTTTSCNRIPTKDAKSDLRKVVQEACKCGPESFAVRLLDMGMEINVPEGWSTRILSDLARLACEGGQKEVLEVLIQRGAVTTGDLFSHDLFEAAVRGGHVNVIRVLIHAGITLRPIQALKLLRKAAPRPCSAEAIWYLLHQNVIFIDQPERVFLAANTNLAQLVTVAVRCANIGFVEALFRYGVPLDDEAFYADQDLPVPMVTAIAFSQKRVIERLKELGVAEADPLQSIAERHFRNGTYPCDPPEPLKWNEIY